MSLIAMEMRCRKFKACKSVHHYTIQINYQLDATISPVYYPDIYLQLNIFGRPHAHHQELNNCSSSLWFYLHLMVVAMLFSMDITMIQR